MTALRALIACIVLSTAAQAAVEPLPGFAEARTLLERSLTAAARADLAAHADLPLYRITARWDAERRLLIGSEIISWRNRAGWAARDLGFRTLANGPNYQAASMVVTDIRIDGERGTGMRATDGGSGLLVDLPRPIASGGGAWIELSFALAPSRSDGYHGLDVDGGANVCLYGWYPDLAPQRSPEAADGPRAKEAWDLRAMAALCDPTSLGMTNVVAELDLPDGCAVATGGVIADERRADGRHLVTIASAFTRDLVVVMADQLVAAERQIAGTTVRSWWLPGDDAGGAAALDIAAQALELYSGRFGTYPYAELDVVDVPLGENVGGMESTSLVLIDRGCYGPYRRAGADPAPMAQFMMEMCVSHEVGHQWWYGLVGSDAWTSAWLDESLTNWTGCWYLEQRGGPALANAGWSMSLAECSSAGATTVPATLDAGDYSLADYGGVVYGRGALMYQALRRQLGEEGFFAFLRSWFADHRYGRVEPADWRGAVAQALGAEAGAAFARKWLDAQGLTRRELMEATRPAPGPRLRVAPPPATAPAASPAGSQIP